MNGKWIANTNYQDQLSTVTWEVATKKVGSLNNLAALTFHIHYYIAGVLQVFEGGDLTIRDKFSFDLPEIRNEADWQRLCQKLFTDAVQFATHVERMSEEQLDSVFIDEKYGTFRRNIEGIIEHSYYHLGQVSLIRKMVELGEAT